MHHVISKRVEMEHACLVMLAVRKVIYDGRVKTYVVSMLILTGIDILKEALFYYGFIHLVVNCFMISM